jgi:hypothetical protein
MLRHAVEAAKSMPVPQPGQEPTIPRQPVPTRVNVNPVQLMTPDGFQGAVKVDIQTPVGETTLFFPPEFADTVAGLLTKAAERCRSKLEVVGG